MQVAAAISPADGVNSATRASGIQERKAEGGPSALMPVSASRWSAQWQYLEDKVHLSLSLHPLKHVCLAVVKACLLQRCSFNTWLQDDKHRRLCASAW